MLRNYDSNKPQERVERRSIDPKFILAIINQTTAYTGQKMLEHEVEGLVHYVKQIDFNLLKKYKPDQIINVIARNFIQQMNVKKGVLPNMQEIKKRHIGAIPHDGPDSVYASREYPPYNPAGNQSNIATIGLKEQFSNKEKGEQILPITDVVEKFGTRARNTDETNAPYMKAPEDAISELKTDIHEMLKILVNPQAEQTIALENSTRPFNPLTYKYPRINKQRVQNIYLLLDSKFRELSTDDNTYKWTVLHSNSTTQGTVNTLSDQIHNIINIQFDRFIIPYVESADNVYRRISLEIEEFSSMSVLLNNGRRYHMLFTAEISGPSIELTPQINDEGRFRFYTPVNILNTITIKFKSPFSPVNFLPDRYLVTIASINPTQSTLTFSVDHNVADGELVHIEEYTTLAPEADDAQINFVNREEGHIVTFISNTVLRIDAALATVTPDITHLSKVFIATRRIIIPVRMEYLVE